MDLIMKINLPNTLDRELLKQPGEYFPAWLKKHLPQKFEARNSNDPAPARARKISRIQQAVKT